LDVDGGHAGTKCVIFQRDWCAEHGHDAVAGELTQRAAVALHHCSRTIQQVGHQFAQPLRALRRSDVHGTDCVGEQHRHLLVLGGGVPRLDRGSAFEAELGIAR
jgi:hypothetical protein